MAYLLFPNVGTSSAPKTLATTDDIINVVANPSSTTATLTGITIGNTSYAVSSGSDNDHYPTAFTWTNGTTAGPTGSLTGNSGFTAVSFGAIPSASNTQSGIITTGTQTFGGEKTFKSKTVIGNSSLSSPTAVLDIGKTAYGGGFTFYSAGTGNGGYLEGQFNGSYSSFPYIKDISQVIFHKGYGATHAADTYSTVLTSTSQPTANRTITLPDNSGTVALTSDLPIKGEYPNEDNGYVTPKRVLRFQQSFAIAPDPLHNINNHDLSGTYTATSTTITISGINYPVIIIQEDGSSLSTASASNYMMKMTGSEFIPMYGDGTVPRYSYMVIGDGYIYKPQYDSTNGLVL